MDRPHCLNRDACAAKTPGRHCIKCTCNTPEFRARLAANAKARYADPAERQRMSEAKKKALRDPAKRQRVVSALLKMVEKRGAPTIDIEKRRAWIASLSPEERRARFARKGLTAGLTAAELEMYNALKRKGFSAKEARALVDEDSRQKIHRITAEMQARAAREKAMAY